MALWHGSIQTPCKGSGYSTVLLVWENWRSGHFLMGPNMGWAGPCFREVRQTYFRGSRNGRSKRADCGGGTWAGAGRQQSGRPHFFTRTSPPLRPPHVLQNLPSIPAVFLSHDAHTTAPRAGGGGGLLVNGEDARLDSGGGRRTGPHCSFPRAAWDQKGSR